MTDGRIVVSLMMH